MESNVKNKARVAKRENSETQRKQAPVQTRRVDTSQLAITSNRSLHGSGGGAFNPLMLLPFVLVVIYRKRKGASLDTLGSKEVV